MTLLAYRFALDPTPAQGRALRSHAGAGRVAFNWGLARVKAVMDQRAAEATYGITGDDLTPAISWSLYALRKNWNAAKDTVAPRKVRRLSRPMSRRRGPDRRTRQQPSNRWQRAAVTQRKAQGRVADQRRDALYKATTGLTGRFGTLVIEDLAVPNMTRRPAPEPDPDRPGAYLRNGARAKAGLNRAALDVGWSEFRRQAGYKAAWCGGTVIVADRWFASSKTCSGCGAVKAKLLLSERTYVCAACGTVADRDQNAARNLAGYGKHQLAASGADSNGRGADRKTGLARQVAVKRQPGMRQRRQTGTVPTRDGTAA